MEIWSKLGGMVPVCEGAVSYFTRELLVDICYMAQCIGNVA